MSVSVDMKAPRRWLLQVVGLLRHAAEHYTGLNACVGLIDHENPAHDHLRPSTWRMGVRCLDCGLVTWWDS